jgi:hypothetical protein
MTTPDYEGQLAKLLLRVERTAPCPRCAELKDQLAKVTDGDKNCVTQGALLHDAREQITSLKEEVASQKVQLMKVVDLDDALRVARHSVTATAIRLVRENHDLRKIMDDRERENHELRRHIAALLGRSDDAAKRSPENDRDRAEAKSLAAAEAVASAPPRRRASDLAQEEK